MAINNIKPMTDVTLEKGKTRRFTKKLRYEKKTPDNEIRFQPQATTASIL
jgi:hypothetical protein